MAPTRGWLDPQGCPFTKIAIFPEGRPDVRREVEALIDTGFTGFAQIPFAIALSIGLSATGTMDLTFAGGTTEPTPVSWASIQLGPDIREGLVFLSDRSDEILVGVHFLRLFGTTLTFSVGSGVVELS